MTYRVVFIETEEGVAALCPGLPGCASQGVNQADALNNVREAIALWLDAGGTMRPDGGAAAEAEMRREAAADSLKIMVREVGLAVAA